jgi:hypothetical protein
MRIGLILKLLIDYYLLRNGAHRTRILRILQPEIWIYHIKNGRTFMKMRFNHIQHQRKYIPSSLNCQQRRAQPLVNIISYGFEVICHPAESLLSSHGKPVSEPVDMLQTDSRSKSGSAVILRVEPQLVGGTSGWHELLSLIPSFCFIP